MSGADTKRARREVVRALRLTASAVPCRDDGPDVLIARTRGEARLPRLVVDALIARGALRRADGQLVRTAAGGATLRRLLSEPGLDAHAEQHRARTADTIDSDPERGTVPERVVRNRMECPLDRLAAARDADGSPFLSPEMVEAGRRLRTDFERGALRSRVTMAWEAPTSTGSGARSAAGATLTDSAMAARDRYAHAVDALGPRLGPAVADLVAHEMGLTDIEHGRGWPARSGKMMLREALDRLAAHYRSGERHHRRG